MKNLKSFLFLMVLALSFVPMIVQAAPIALTFDKITNNNVEDIGGQLKLTIYDYTDANTNYASGLLNPSLTNTQVLFVFQNLIGVPSNVAEIYVDEREGFLTSIRSPLVIISTSGVNGVNFLVGGMTPPNLPGGNTISPAFVADDSLSVDTGLPSGIHQPGLDHVTDILGIIYNTSGVYSYADITGYINNHSLRIGIHARSIGQAGSSDAYINDDAHHDVVPEPATMLLLGLGLMGLAGARRKFRQ